MEEIRLTNSRTYGRRFSEVRTRNMIKLSAMGNSGKQPMESHGRTVTASSAARAAGERRAKGARDGAVLILVAAPLQCCCCLLSKLRTLLGQKCTSFARLM